MAYLLGSKVRIAASTLGCIQVADVGKASCSRKILDIVRRSRGGRKTVSGIETERSCPWALVCAAAGPAYIILVRSISSQSRRIIRISYRRSHSSRSLRKSGRAVFYVKHGSFAQPRKLCCRKSYVSGT
ncbi:hypothetical protein D3C72_590370 [compost metagenome]